MSNRGERADIPDEESAPVSPIAQSLDRPSISIGDDNPELNDDDDAMTEVDVDDEGNQAGEYISRLERQISQNQPANILTPVSESGDL